MENQKMEKELLWERLSDMGKALGSAERLKIIQLLAQCERSVEELSQVVEAPINRVSHHLQRLKTVDLVRGKRQGRHIFYSLTNPDVLEFWIDYLAFVEKHLPELRLSAKNEETIDYEEARRLVEAQKAVMIDIRPRAEYEADHLPGAISLPLKELNSRLPELRQYDAVILCCRGSFCKLADVALGLLQSEGIRAFRLKSGVIERQMRYRHSVGEKV